MLKVKLSQTRASDLDVYSDGTRDRNDVVTIAVGFDEGVCRERGKSGGGGGRWLGDGAGATRCRPQRFTLERQMPPLFSSSHSPGPLSLPLRIFMCTYCLLYSYSYLFLSQFALSVM